MWKKLISQNADEVFSTDDSAELYVLIKDLYKKLKNIEDAEKLIKESIKLIKKYPSDSLPKLHKEWESR